MEPALSNPLRTTDPVVTRRMTAPYPWLLNRREDLIFFVLSPLLSVALVLAFVALSDGLNIGAESLARAFFFVFIVFFDNPHILQTFSRTHFDPVERKRHFFLHLALLFALLGTVLWRPDLVRELWFQSFFAIFGTWHIYAQNVGFLKLYGRRSPVEEVDRKAERFFYFMLFNAYLTKIGIVDLSASAAELGEGGPVVLGMLGTLNRIFEGVVAVSGVFLVARWVTLLRRKAFSFSPRLVLLLSLTLSYSVNYLVLGILPVLAMQVFDTLYHDVQYLRWMAHYQERSVPGKRYAVKWALACLGLSACFYFGENILQNSLGLFVPLGAVFVMLTVYHYFVDGIIWKFRSQSELAALVRPK